MTFVMPFVFQLFLRRVFDRETVGEAREQGASYHTHQSSTSEASSCERVQLIPRTDPPSALGSDSIPHSSAVNRQTVGIIGAEGDRRQRDVLRGSPGILLLEAAVGRQPLLRAQVSAGRRSNPFLFDPRFRRFETRSHPKNCTGPKKRVSSTKVDEPVFAQIVMT